MNKCYYRIVWKNYPDVGTPLNEQNLNKIDVATDEMDNRILTLDSAKFDKSEAQLLIKYVEYDEDTGIFKITHHNGASYTIDTLLEKLAINFDYDYQTQKLIITLSDGTEKYVDLSALITQYEFVDSDTIAFTLDANGKVSAKIKEGSIEEKHLRPDYLADVKVEVAKAEASAGVALDSQHAAKLSEDNALASANASADSAQDSADSAAAALESEQNSRESEEAALGHKNAAKISEDNAVASAVAAGESKESAAGSARAAAGSAADAKASEDAAEASASQAEYFSLMSKSYANGTEGEVRPGDATDNSKFYSELAQYLTDEAAKLLDQAQKLIAAATAGAIIPSGTVAFENLPTEPQVGYMYNISNSFVTDDRFAEGPGIQYNPGANVYWTRDGQWDVMIGVQVTGVKGAAESFYRQGNVDITPANIGLGNVPNVGTNDQTPTFTQAATRENIASGNKLSVILGKIMKWFADLKAVAFSGSYTDLSNKPTALKNPSALTFTGAVTGSYDGSAAKSVAIPSVGNGTVTIKQAGASKGSFTTNQSGNTTIELTDNNTWRPVQDNLNSTSTTDSLSASQGKVLDEKKYDKSGGTVNGRINAGGKVEMWTDGEGGNVRITGKDETLWEADAYNGDLRIFTYANGVKTGIIINKNGEVSFPSGATTNWSWVQNKPSTYPPSSHRHSWGEIDGRPDDVGGTTAKIFNYIGYGTAIAGHVYSYSIGGGVYILNVQGSIVQANTGGEFDWGINLTAILSYSKLNTGMRYVFGSWKAFREGVLQYIPMGYGTAFSETSKGGYRVLLPGRYYQADGAYGGWGSGSAIAQPGTFWEATIVVM